MAWMYQTTGNNYALIANNAIQIKESLTDAYWRIEEMAYKAHSILWLVFLFLQ